MPQPSAQPAAFAPLTSSAPRYVSERAWVDALRTGDRAARAVAFDRYAPRVRRFLGYLIPSAADADDVLQDVFVEIFRSVERLRGGPDALDGWVHRVAVNTARRALRRAYRRRRWLMVGEPKEPAAEPGPDPEAASVIRGTFAVLRRLAPDDQLLLTLRFVEELELTEVAERCGMSLATVKRRLDRAKRRFRAHAAGHPELLAPVSRSEGT